MTNSITTIQVRHYAYNLEKKDNLQELPSQEAVFGIFGIVDEKPVNCRFIGQSDHLQSAIRSLFEDPPGEGLRRFMQGPWIQLLLYIEMPGSSREERQKVVEQWSQTYAPKIDPDGEYPGYY